MRLAAQLAPARDRRMRDQDLSAEQMIIDSEKLIQSVKANANTTRRQIEGTRAVIRVSRLLVAATRTRNVTNIPDGDSK